MKNLSNILSVAVLAGMFSLANRVNAQYIGEDGIAASPKLRQMLNERKSGSTTTSQSVASVSTPSEDRIALSPRARQMLNESRVVASTSSTATASAGYQLKGEDGITASPKGRQQLNERGAHFMVAPVK